VIGTAGGQQHVHTLHFRNQDGTGTLQSLIDAWQTEVGADYRGCFSDQDLVCQLYRASMVCGAAPLPASVEEVGVAPDIDGSVSVAGDRLPPWLARVVSVRTPNGGKSYRGRFYLGGMWEGWTVGSTIQAAPLVPIQTYATGLIDHFVTPAFGTGGWRLVVHSRKLASVPGTQCQVSSTLVSGLIVRSEVGSMKSRKAGSGI
jgi:hypothetical protein